MKRQNIETEIQTITKQIVEKYKPEKVILFGSAARGEFKPESDLDFLIIKKTSKKKVERMREIADLVSRKTPSDFLVYTPEELEKRLSIGDYFVEDVLKEGRILYGS